MSDSLFINDEKNKSEKVRPEKAPKGYIEVKLSSNGKLGLPAKIHVRNYNGQDALDLAMVTEEDVFETLVETISSMVYEDIDTDMLHEQDLQEIMLNIYFNFWGNSLEYPYTPSIKELEGVSDKRKERLISGEEQLSILVDPKSIKTKTLSNDFKSPISIEDNYQFILPTIGHTLNAKYLTEEKFQKEENELAFIQDQLTRNEELIEKGLEPKYKVSPVDKRKFFKYQKNRMKYFTLLTQAQLLHSVDNKELSTLEEKEEAYKVVPLDVWRKYNTYLKENADFGVDPLVKVASPITKELIERRVVFRPMDFLPSMDT